MCIKPEYHILFELILCFNLVNFCLKNYIPYCANQCQSVLQYNKNIAYKVQIRINPIQNVKTEYSKYG